MKIHLKRFIKTSSFSI